MRNEVSHFSVTPTVDVQRSRFDRPFNHKFTGNVGTLIPHYWAEILPGDTVQLKTSKVIRLSTLLDPVMDNLYADTYYFFVPMRLVFDKYREFFKENTSGPWYPQTEYTIPQIIVAGGTTEPVPQSIADYMGIPRMADQQGNLLFSALPIRAYNVVYRDWFMSEAVETPPNIYTGPDNEYYSPNTPLRGGPCYLANKLHDYFTSALPAPQRGPSIAVPLQGTMDLGSPNVMTATTVHSMGTNGLRLGVQSGSTINADSYVNLGGVSDTSHGTNTLYTFTSVSPSDSKGKVTYSNLVVPMTSVQMRMNDAFNINDLRYAFQMQKWLEKSSLYGGRYIEMLKAQFGVTSPDARLQRSEYLGGNRVPISVHQVENTYAGGEVPLGHLGAFSATSDVSDDFIHSFSEHGFLIGVTCVRYKHSYPNGLERAWQRKTMWDYFFPLMANLGNMPILRSEIFVTGDETDEEVFGYQEAWADYRYMNDRVSGYFKPGISGSLASWHFADNYNSAPYLSEEWLAEDKANVDRCLAVSSSQAPQLLFDYEVDSTWTRCMPLYSIPGLIDHH